MKATKIALTRGLPKTGQTVERMAGDDSTYQAGWWVGKTIATKKKQFAIKGTIPLNVVIDRATGLMWAGNGNQAGGGGGIIRTWANSIDYALALNFGGFTDWRLPNILELLSIVDYSEFSPCVNASFFVNQASLPYWSSTNGEGDPNHRHVVDFAGSEVSRFGVGSSANLRCVRGGL